MRSCGYATAATFRKSCGLGPERIGAGGPGMAVVLWFDRVPVCRLHHLSEIWGTNCWSHSQSFVSLFAGRTMPFESGPADTLQNKGPDLPLREIR